jgi:GTPase SAR1 family protein
VKGADLVLDIQEIGGSYVNEFPAMLSCSLASADAVLLVFSVSDLASFEEASRLRDLVQQQRGEELPLVVVGNKTDLTRQITSEEAEATVLCDWENGYVECCAKDNLNIAAIFKALLIETKQVVRLPASPSTMTRRQSLPQVPAFRRLQKQHTVPPAASPSGRRRISIGPSRPDSCRQQ